MLYVHHFYKRQSRELAELPRFAGTAKIHEKRFENTAFFFIYDRVFDFLLMFLRNKWTLIWRKKQKVSFTCCNLYDNLYLHQFLFYINKGLKKKLFFPMFFFIFFLCSCPIVMIIFHDFCILDKDMVHAAE